MIVFNCRRDENFKRNESDQQEKVTLMEKPSPKKNARCDGCQEVKPLLMPMGYAPGFPIIVWEHLCMECRTSQQMSRYSSSYYMPAYHLEHSACGVDRAAYQEWLAADFTTGAVE